jgi:site-specific recombinase XerD
MALICQGWHGAPWSTMGHPASVGRISQVVTHPERHHPMAYAPTQLPSLRWQGAYRLGRQGKRVTRTFDSYGEAQEWAEAAEAAARAELAQPGDTQPTAPASSLTVSEHGAHWLTLKATKAKATRDGYATHLRGIAATGMGARVMATVTNDQIQQWVNSQDAAGVGRSTINARLKVLRMLFRHAKGNHLIAVDPTPGVTTLPVAIRQAGNLEREQVQALLDVATPTEAVMVMLATDSGLRWQEMAGLPASSVAGDFLIIRQVVERSTGTIRHYPKSKVPRVVSIGTERLADALAPLVKAARATGDPDALLFTNRAGRPLDYYDWRRDTWRPLKRKAAMPRALRFHDLRHTFGSTLADRNVPIATIQKELGHASQTTTERYIHAATDGRRLALVREALSA